MRRREFIAGLGGAVAWPAMARAQRAERVRRVGVLMGYSEDDPEARLWIEAFNESFHNLGWTDGHDVRIDYRWGADDPTQDITFAAELVSLAPDVILATTTPAVMAMRQATAVIPIVFITVPDPILAGLSTSLAQPDKNLTGFSNYEFPMSGKWLQLLTAIAPQTVRVAAVYDPRITTWKNYFDGLTAAASSLRVQLIAAAVRNPVDIDRAIVEFAVGTNGGLIIFPSSLAAVNRERIIRLAASHRLPAMYPVKYYAKSGGLMAYGTDYLDLYRRASSYVDRILRGSKIAELPIQLPTSYDLTINLKTAKALGLTIPETLLVQADGVIE
jgi:putative ABC transport system substrate-binding protein